MKKIHHLPVTPKVINCPKHGDFEVRYMKIGDGYWPQKGCLKCADEREAKEKADEKASQKAHLAKIHDDARLKAGVSRRNLNKKFDDYICETQQQSRAKKVCQDFVNNFPSDKNILMLGSVGTGKTLLSSIVIDCLVDRYSCKIIKAIEIIRAIKRSWKRDSDYSEDDVIDSLISKDLLIIDEIGSQFGSDTERLYIFDIIDGRYQDMKPTILISNLDIDGVKNVVGERCVDRLREGGGEMIAFNWDSKRA